MSYNRRNTEVEEAQYYYYRIETHKGMNALNSSQYLQEMNSFSNSSMPDELYAFSMTSLMDIMKEFSDISIPRVAIGYILMVRFFNINFHSLFN